MTRATGGCPLHPLLRAAPRSSAIGPFRRRAPRLPLRPTLRMPTNRPTAAARSACAALLRVVSNFIVMLHVRATPRPSTTGPLHQRALHLPLRPTPRLPTDSPTAVTPTDCIAHLNVTPNLTLLPHFLPTSQITISNVSDHRQLCCLLHPIRTDPRSHHITFRPSPQRCTTT